LLYPEYWLIAFGDDREVVDNPGNFAAAAPQSPPRNGRVMGK
jgi:hypothetical protein